MDLLADLNDVRTLLEQVPTDSVDQQYCLTFNRAKNKLMEIIADGERRIEAKRVAALAIGGGSGV